VIIILICSKVLETLAAWHLGGTGRRAVEAGARDQPAVVGRTVWGPPGMNVGPFRDPRVLLARVAGRG
jgi:hypothetical protein